MKKTARNKKETVFVRAEESIIEAVIPSEEEQKEVKRFFRTKPFLVGSLVIIVILVSAGALYSFLYFQKDAKPTNAQLTSEQISKLVNDVGMLMVLPEGETPTIATVTDVEKLAAQPFFRTAQNGDKVLLFGSTKEAILYRPSIGKIIKVATINDTNISTPPANLAPQGVPVTPSVTPIEKKIKVTILNSTKEAGLARKAGLLLPQEKYEITTSNAVGEYPITSITRVAGSNVIDSDLNVVASSLALIKPQVKSLPNEETAPNGSEVVIILGSDFSEKY